jgi:hypothetical protein
MFIKKLYEWIQSELEFSYENCMDFPVVHVILGMPFVWKDQEEGVYHCWSRIWYNVMLEESHHK